MGRSVFISYSHADEALKDELLIHLASLRREGLVEVWHDRLIRPGHRFDPEIEQQLASAHLIVLLISAHFINSDYCSEREMVEAFRRASNGEANVATIILRPCQWKNIPLQNGGRLGDFMALPTDGRPVTQYLDRDVAWDEIVTALRAFFPAASVASARSTRAPERMRRSEMMLCV